MNTPIPRFALRQTRALLRRLATRANRAAKAGDEEAIHDLRVAIRRFTQALRVFGQFLPRGKTRKIRRRLKDIMNAAAEVRNRDIALDMVGDAELGPDSPLPGVLRAQREEARRNLVRLLKKWNSRDFSRRWREQLEL